MEDNTPYKKKKDQKSKSIKRSDHKHQYEKIIMRSIVGWQWIERCTQCGRLKYNKRFIDKEFIKPEYQSKPYISDKSYWTYAEMVKLFPDIEIIDKAPWEE